MIYNCKKCGTGRLKIDQTYPYHDIYECLDCNHPAHISIQDCCRTPFTIVTIHRYDHDRYALYHQCLNCGGAERTKPLSQKEFGEQIRGEFNQDFFQEWKNQKKAESTMLYESLKYANYQNTNAYKYHQYLQSYEWKSKRKLVLNRDNNLCQICKTEQALDIHHLRYENLYNEPLEDLQALCRDCHVNMHREEYLKI